MSSKIPANIKREFKYNNKNMCYYCNCCNPLIMSVDHKVALSNGGSDDLENLVVCCLICNNLKGNMSDSEFKAYIKNLKHLYFNKQLDIRVGVKVKLIDNKLKRK